MLQPVHGLVVGLSVFKQADVCEPDSGTGCRGYVLPPAIGGVFYIVVPVFGVVPVLCDGV